MMHQNWLIKHWSTQGSVMSCCSVNGRYPRCPLMLHEWNWTNCSSGILVSVLKLNSLADVSIGRTVVRKGAVRVLQKSIVCGALQTKHLEYKMPEWGWLFDSQSKQKLYLTSVHNLVQVSCYGSCSGSHHEVKTLWGPAMVHQSPVCSLTPHLFLESHMVWLDLAEDDGHDWFMVQMVMTAHYWQSTQSASPILRRQLCEASFATITIMLKQCNFHPLVDVKEMWMQELQRGSSLQLDVDEDTQCIVQGIWWEILNHGKKLTALTSGWDVISRTA